MQVPPGPIANDRDNAFASLLDAPIKHRSHVTSMGINMNELNGDIPDTRLFIIGVLAP